MNKKPNEPKLNHVRVIMDEDMEVDTNLLFQAIVAEMTKKKANAGAIREFLAEYFRTKEKGRDELMKFFHSWVRLQKEKTT